MVDNEKYQDNSRTDELSSNDYKSLSSLSKERKIAAGILVVLAIAIIAVWFSQLKKSLNPLSYINESGTKTATTQQDDSEDSLRNKDTDGDGLSDWDELNLYKTSPYLEDSDSDGFSDKNEIDSGNDPNCPTGRNCLGAGLGNSTSDNTGSEDLTKNILNGIANDTTGVGTSGVLSTSTSAGILRQMLLEAGFSKDALDKISDEDLVRAYQESIKKQQ